MPDSTMANSGVRAAAWKLARSDPEQPTESARIPDDGGRNQESIIGHDGRTLVDLQDLKDGGKYRSIVKIFSKFEDPKNGDVWMMGTGWLIQSDVLVTAGHVVYDWGYHLGAATEIKCYIGYNGRASVKTPDVQARYGESIVTTTEWVSKAGSRPYDVAFVRLNKPFTGDLNLVTYVDTPVSGDVKLGVVGYPGDRVLALPNEVPETGAQAWKQFEQTRYDLRTSERHMIDYKISTFAGQSGAPILQEERGALVSIGCHTYGGGGVDKNSGNSINGRYGNNYHALTDLFTTQASEFGTSHKINQHIRVGAETNGIPKQNGSHPWTNGDFNGNYSNGNYSNGNGSTEDDRNGRSKVPGLRTEGFMDVFRTVTRVGSTVLPFASPFLGPIGGVVSAIGGGVLNAMAGSGSESMVAGDTPAAVDGATNRALLAEAALQAVLRLDGSPETSELFAKMRQTWPQGVTAAVDPLVKPMVPLLTKSALGVATNRLETTTEKRPKTEANIDFYRSRQPLRHTEVSQRPSRQNAFAEALLAPTLPVAGEEGMFDMLGPLIGNAISFGAPLARQAATAGIQLAATQLAGLVGGHEAALITPEYSEDEKAIRILLHRAVMAETALQSLMTMPKEKMDNLKMTSSADGETEGFIDFIKTTAQKLGPYAIDAAKMAAQKVVPLIMDAATQKINQKLGVENARAPAITKQRSMLDLINCPDTLVEVSSAQPPGGIFLALPEVDPSQNPGHEENSPSQKRDYKTDPNPDAGFLSPPPPAGP